MDVDWKCSSVTPTTRARTQQEWTGIYVLALNEVQKTYDNVWNNKYFYMCIYMGDDYIIIKYKYKTLRMYQAPRPVSRRNH